MLNSSFKFGSFLFVCTWALLQSCGGSEEGHETTFTANDTLINTDYLLTDIMQVSQFKSLTSENFDNWCNKLDTVIVNGVIRYILEGDMILNRDELYTYYCILMPIDTLFKNTSASMYIEEWNDQKITIGTYKKGSILNRIREDIKLHNNNDISFCIDALTFNEEEYKIIKNNSMEAAQDWNKACNVNFNYKGQYDSSKIAASKVFFVIRQKDFKGKFFASAFFPNSAPIDRVVYIDPSYFSTKYDKVGVFRHEFGHILGFIHEHNKAGLPPQCPDFVTVPSRIIGKYDSLSVMHYMCEGTEYGSWELKLTDRDIKGAREVYKFDED